LKYSSPTERGFMRIASASPEKAGYNWQWNSFVLGVEGDIAWRDRTATANLIPFVPGNVTDQVNATNKQGWLATVRPRAGVAWGNALLYVTSGAASSNRPGNADAAVVPSVS
jgi:opacity protein-like surface antigen